MTKKPEKPVWKRALEIGGAVAAGTAAAAGGTALWLQNAPSPEHIQPLEKEFMAPAKALL